MEQPTDSTWFAGILPVAIVRIASTSSRRALEGGSVVRPSSSRPLVLKPAFAVIAEEIGCADGAIGPGRALLFVVQAGKGHSMRASELPHVAKEVIGVALCVVGLQSRCRPPSQRLSIRNQAIDHRFDVGTMVADAIDARALGTGNALAAISFAVPSRSAELRRRGAQNCRCAGRGHGTPVRNVVSTPKVDNHARKRQTRDGSARGNVGHRDTLVVRRSVDRLGALPISPSSGRAQASTRAASGHVPHARHLGRLPDRCSQHPAARCGS